MKAVVLESYGRAPVVREIADPIAKPDEAVIAVDFAAVNPVDWKICEGLLKAYYDWPLPFVPGCDIAGRIVALGANARGFSLGDPVFACTFPHVPGSGAFAEKVAVPVTAIALAPRSIALEAAAGVPLAALTAWQAFHDFAKLKPGDKVLIHAAAGGVGSFAVPIAKATGAYVVGTASAVNRDYVRGLGADEFIDYRAEDFVTASRRFAPDGFDVVLDGAGGDALARSFAVTRRGGAFASIVGAPDEAAATRAGVRSEFIGMEGNGSQLAAIAALIDRGQLRPAPIEVFPLAQVSDAFARSKAKHVRGKLVLKVR